MTLRDHNAFWQEKESSSLYGDGVDYKHNLGDRLEFHSARYTSEKEGIRVLIFFLVKAGQIDISSALV